MGRNHAPPNATPAARMSLLDLFKPCQLGPVKIRNRLVCAEQESLVDEDDEPTPWGRETLGAFGLCLLDAGSVHPSSRMQLNLFDEQAATLHRPLRRAKMPMPDETRRIQRLTHGGNLYPSVDGSPPWAASSQRGPTGIVGHAMTPAQLLELRLSFVSAALMCQENGLDGVQISVCSGNVFQQFLSSRHNPRTDAYGGSYANRSRFLFETVRAVRAAVGPAFVLGVGLGRDADAPHAAAGMASTLLPHLASEGLVDYVEIFEASISRPQGTHGLPRILTTSCSDLDQAADHVASGSADLVALGPEVCA